MIHLMFLFSSSVRISTRRLNKNLICCPKINHFKFSRLLMAYVWLCTQRLQNYLMYNFKLLHFVEVKKTLFSVIFFKKLFKEHIMLKIFLPLCMMIIFTLFSTQSIAGASVAFSKDTIGMNETVELIFSSDEPIKNAPDMNEVERHFRVSGQQVQEHASIVKGKLTYSYQFIFNVRPLREGKIILKDLTLDGQKLKPVTLNVVRGATSFAGGNSDSLTLQALSTVKQVYEGESFVYKLVLFDASKIIGGQIFPPKLTDADIRPLGRDNDYRGVKNGKTVRIIERSFLVTPKLSGILTFNPAVFEGLSRETLKAYKTPNELFGMGILLDGLTNFTTPVSAQSEAISIEVLPKPAFWQGWWLPASSVSLTQSFKIPDKITVGQPLERTLKLEATGVSGEQLPELMQPVSNGFKVYPSVPQRRTDESSDGVSGYEELTVVLIPLKSGQQTIPGVEVDWFNTKTRQRQTAKVPAKTIMVVSEAEAGLSANDGSDALNAQNGMSAKNESMIGIDDKITPAISIGNNNISDNISALYSKDGRQRLPEAFMQTQPNVHQTSSDDMVQPLPSPPKQFMQPQEEIGQGHDWLLILLGIIIGMSTTGLIMYFYVRRQTAKKKKPLPDLYPF